MRLILYLVGSLIVAAMIFAVLIMTDVLRFNSDSVLTEREAVRKKITSNVVADGPEGVEKKVTADDAPRSMRTDEKGSMDEPMTGNLNESPTHGLSSAVHAKALEFLSAQTEKGGADIEDQFARFLVNECDVDQKMAARMIRMSFWKNFVTLQDKWKEGETDMLRASFAMEKELKQAGFAAMGLSIMSGEIRMAEDELAKLENRLKASVPEENK
jgi:hypothetical protein